MTDKSGGSALINSRLKVLSWNVWWKFGEWEKRQSPLIETLKSVDADVICLQEVWSDANTNQAAVFAAELGFHHTFQSSMQMKDDGFGNAILSRWPIKSQDYRQLSGQKETGETRLAMFAEIDGPRGAIPLFCTHLNWKFDQSHIRQQQVRDLAEFVSGKNLKAFPPIVCGDFNADPISDEIRMMTGQSKVPVNKLVFHDAWAFANGEQAGMTWNNQNPNAVPVFEADRRIDFIFSGFAHKNSAGHIVGCKLAGDAPVDGVWPSDHSGVLAEFRY